MTNTKKSFPALSQDNPLVRDSLIIETVFSDKLPGKSIIKYIAREKVNGTWQDVVKSQFIDNENGVDFSGRTLRFTTEIV